MARWLAEAWQGPAYTPVLAIGSAGNVALLVNDGAGLLAQRNGTVTQEFRLYDTFVSTADYRRAFLRYTAGQAFIGTESAIEAPAPLNLVSDAAIGFVLASTPVWSINGAGNFVPGTNGSYDFGSTTLGVKRLYIDYTNTGTVGNVTINKAAGRVKIAGAGTSVAVTNSLATAASHILAVMSSGDATGRVTSVVPTAGSFTINTVATSGTASFDFFILNAD